MSAIIIIIVLSIITIFMISLITVMRKRHRPCPWGVGGCFPAAVSIFCQCCHHHHYCPCRCVHHCHYCCHHHRHCFCLRHLIIAIAKHLHHIFCCRYQDMPQEWENVFKQLYPYFVIVIKKCLHSHHFIITWVSQLSHRCHLGDCLVAIGTAYLYLVGSI